MSKTLAKLSREIGTAMTILSELKEKFQSLTIEQCEVLISEYEENASYVMQEIEDIEHKIDELQDDFHSKEIEQYQYERASELLKDRIKELKEDEASGRN
jgi:peptidoglycan hydrolase CwlO-like protein